MAQAQLKEVDGVLMLPLSAEVQAQLSLNAGSSVEMNVDGAELIVRAEGGPNNRRRHKLSELLADYDQIPRDEQEDRIWLNSPPAGRELL